MKFTPVTRSVLLFVSFRILILRTPCDTSLIQAPRYLTKRPNESRAHIFACLSSPLSDSLERTNSVTNSAPTFFILVLIMFVGFF